MKEISAKVYKYHATSIGEIEACYEPERKQENIEAVWEAFAKAKQGMLFSAHLSILEDEFLVEEIIDVIRQEGAKADYAIAKVLDGYIEQFGQSKEEMLVDKTLDLQDVREHLLWALKGAYKENVLAQIQEEVILVAKELLPSDVLAMNPAYIKGIILEKGSPLSHVAILAKTRGIPMITQAEGVWESVEDGQLIKRKFAGNETCVETITELGGLLGINVDNPNWDMPDESYDFIGLYRTEYQYIEAVELPTEEELFENYKMAIEHAKGKSVTFRTIDIGGDKTPNYMKAAEPLRGISVCFAYPEVFKTQLRAMLRASVYGRVRVMFPMVRSVEEIRKAKRYVQAAMEELEQEHIAFDKQLLIGVMIETCELAQVAEQVVHEVDFASVGTNDLIASITGISREEIDGNMYEEETMERIFAILEDVFSVFKKAQKAIYVCGEMAACPEYAKRFLQLGATGLSINP